MRVLHAAAGNLYGGVERILVEIARAGDRAVRHEFAICFDGRLARELRACGATVHDLGTVRFSRPPSVWHARRRLRSLLAGSDDAVVVAHSPWTYSLVAPAARPARRVVWIHDVLHGGHWTERRIVADPPDLAICNSMFSAHAFGQWAACVPQAVVYAPVHAFELTAGARESVRRDVGEPDARTVVVIASRFERLKGHAALLRALAGVSGEWSLWIVGGAQRAAEREYLSELDSLSQSLRIAERVRMFGERADVPRILQAADVLCQPNTAPEAFGLVFVEALLARLPVVTTAVGGALEIVTRECGVLVPGDDAPALTDALQRLIDDPALRRGLGTAGPARARALCDPERQLAHLDEVLQPVAAGARR